MISADWLDVPLNSCSSKLGKPSRRRSVWTESLLLLTCGNCGKVVSTRSSIPDEQGNLKCSCGCTAVVPDVAPSPLVRAMHRLAVSLFSGFIAAFVWFHLGYRCLRIIAPRESLFWLMGLSGGASFVIGAILGERFLYWLLDSFRSHSDSSHR
jgi:hypothetical protein